MDRVGDRLPGSIGNSVWRTSDFRRCTTFTDDFLDSPFALNKRARCVVVEHLVGFDLVVSDGRNREVGVFISFRIVLNAKIDYSQSEIEIASQPNVLRANSEKYLGYTPFTP